MKNFFLAHKGSWRVFIDASGWVGLSSNFSIARYKPVFNERGYKSGTLVGNRLNRNSKIILPSNIIG